MNVNDEKARYVKKKLHETEKNMAAFKKALESYLKSHEHLRGKRLKLALALKAFSESETPNMKKALLSSAESLVDMEEYRKYMHDRIETKAVEPLKLYKLICKDIKDEVKNRENAVLKEQKKQLELDKVTIKDAGNISRISQTKLQAENAAQNLTHATHALADNVERFQSRKIDDVKSILYEIVYSEMQYHSKALEILTNLQSSIFGLELQTDLRELREKLRSHDI